jgi:acetylglutamate kinase
MLQTLLAARYIPVVAPVCLGMFDKCEETNLINVNGDTVAAEVAAALDAEKLIFLTDVPGLYDGSKNLISKLSYDEARVVLESGIASGGMATKIKACLSALAKVSVIRIIDGRVLHALRDEIEGTGEGTTITQ